MATLSLFIKGGYVKPKTNNKGESLLYWKYVHREKTFLVSTKLRINPNHLNWVGKNGKLNIDRFQPILKTSSAYSIKNKNIKLQGEKLASTIEEIKAEGLDPLIERVRDRNKKIGVNKKLLNFFDYIEHLAEQKYSKGQIRRAQKYRCISNKAQTLLKRKTLLLTDITNDLLEEYKRSAKIKENNMTSTINADLKVFRGVLNSAVSEGLISNKQNIAKVKIKDVKTKKNGLDFSQIEKFIKYNPDINSKEFHVKNAWLFSYYNAGIRIGDLFQLSWKNIVNDRLEYTMSKTIESNRPFVSLKLCEEARSILKQYERTRKKGNTLIFPFLHKVEGLVLKYPVDERDGIDASIIETILKEIGTKTSVANQSLEIISKAIGIEGFLIRTHTARHSYSKRAKRLKVSDQNLSELLNHSSTLITKRYSGDLYNDEKDEVHLQIINGG